MRCRLPNFLQTFRVLPVLDILCDIRFRDFRKLSRAASQSKWLNPIGVSAKLVIFSPPVHQVVKVKKFFKKTSKFHRFLQTIMSQNFQTARNFKTYRVFKQYRLSHESIKIYLYELLINTRNSAANVIKEAPFKFPFWCWHEHESQHICNCFLLLLLFRQIISILDFVLLFVYFRKCDEDFMKSWEMETKIRTVGQR